MTEISPLRRRMIEDMTVRNLSPATHRSYLHALCGRFAQNYTWAEVHAFLSVFGTPRNLQPRYYLAPTMTVDVIRQGPQGRELVPCAATSSQAGGRSC